MKKTCICIAGDVQNSSSVESERLVKSLESCAKGLNQSFTEDLIIPFEIRNGDEIVGVIEPFSKGYLAALKMMETLHRDGIRLYIGAGLGELDSAEATVHTMNGTAILNAFQARDDYLKQKHPEAKQWQVNEGTWSTLFFYSEDYPYQALNALAYSILEKIHHRTVKQQEAIQLIRENPAFSYEQIGKLLDYKSPKSTVSYLLSRADYHAVNAMDESLQQLLDDLQKWFKKERT